jgi:hypothetical protein
VGLLVGDDDDPVVAGVVGSYRLCGVGAAAPVWTAGFLAWLRGPSKVVPDGVGSLTMGLAPVAARTEARLNFDNAGFPFVCDGKATHSDQGVPEIKSARRSLGE